MARGEVLGVMCVNYYERREFGGDEQHLIELFAHQAGAVIASSQLARTQERRRLKRDLHDAVKSSVRGMLLLAEEARQALAGDLDRARFCLHEVQRAGRGILTDVNVILNNLEPAGTRKPLKELIEEHLPRHGARAEIEIGDHVPELPSMLERALLYLIREASVNAQTHGRATLMAVRLRCDGGRLHLTIADNGRGFDAQAPSARGHSGLEHMRTRIEEIGGSMHLESSTGQGTTIAFDLPLMEVYDADSTIDPSDSDRRG
jgi:signal transduction histidine kinase